MATKRKPKPKKLPRKPKRGASIQAMESFVRRVKEIDAHNRKQIAEYKKGEAKQQRLLKQIGKINPAEMKSKYKI